MSNENEASAVYVAEDMVFGGWYASILLFTNHDQTGKLTGWGDTRQDAINNLQTEISRIQRLHEHWLAASHSFARFLEEDAT